MRMASHATAFAYSPPSLAYSVLFQSVSCICIPAMPAFIANQASGCAAPATLGTGWYAFHALDCRGLQNMCIVISNQRKNATVSLCARVLLQKSISNQPA